MTSVKRTASFQIAHPVGEIFPLFTPEGEKLWVPDWDYENVMGSTDLRADYVFLTRTHDHAATDAVWIIKTWDTEGYLVEYYKVEPGHKVGIVSVSCEPVTDSLTRVVVSYEYISLSTKGLDFLEEFSEEHFEEFIGEWEAMLLEYFETDMRVSA